MDGLLPARKFHKKVWSSSSSSSFSGDGDKVNEAFKMKGWVIKVDRPSNQ